jgi:hypothetical protein
MFSYLDVEWMLAHHQRPVVAHVVVGILVRHGMADGHHTGIQRTPRRRLAWQKVLNFSFVSAKREKKDTNEVNFGVECEHRAATGYFIIHQTLIYHAEHGIQQNISPSHPVQDRMNNL